MGSARIRPIELIVGIGGSLAVLAVLLAKPPWWEALAIVLATVLPAGLVLYGASAARRAREAQAAEREAQRQREGLARETEEASRSRAELQGRLSELVALNEVAAAVSSTLELESLLDAALAAIVDHLPFDRALVLLVDEEAGVLSHGRSIGGGPDAQALVATVRLPLDQVDSTLVQLALADGPLVFRDVQDDPYEPNRVFARALDVTSFLGTPLETKGRTVGVLAVDNRLSGRERRAVDRAAALDRRQPARGGRRERPAVRRDRGPEPRARGARRAADRPAGRGDRGGPGGAGDGRGDERDEERVPRQRQSRAADAADLGHRLHEDRPATARRGRAAGARRRPRDRGRAGRPAPRAGSPPGRRQPRDRRRRGRAALGADQRRARPREDRGRQDGVPPRARRRRRGRRAGDDCHDRPVRDDRPGAAERDRPGPAGGRRRPASPRPGRHQPPVERGEVHAVGVRHGSGRRRRRRVGRRRERRRHRHRHRARGPGPGLRAVRPGRRHAVRGASRDGPRPRDLPRDRRAPRRPDLARERARSRLDVLVQPARGGRARRRRKPASSRSAREGPRRIPCPPAAASGRSGRRSR